MQNLFLSVLNISINASYLIIAVIILRRPLRNVPKNFRCILWAMAGLRLVCPFSIESLLSLIPQNAVISVTPAPNQNPSPAITDTIGNTAYDSLLTASKPDTAFSFITTAAYIWLAGMAALMFYFLISSIALRKKVSISVSISDNIRACDSIDSPFVLGIIKPQIYIPSHTSAKQFPYIVSHECSHIKRLDNLWKPLGFILLSVYWFNPLVWIAYILLCRDIELACDERTIKEMSLGDKQNYSEALLMCSTAVYRTSVHPLAFGETNVKERVKNVLNYKKPAAWIITIAVLACVIIAVCFLTNPINTKLDDETEAYLHQVILDHSKNSFRNNENFACEDHIILKADRKGNVTTVYALVMYSEFSLKDGVLYEECGSHIPSVITLDMSGSAYSYHYWTSEDGTRYVPSIRDKFPWYLEDKAIKIHKTASEQNERCIRQAEEHFGVKYVDPYANTTHTTNAYTAEN